MQEQPILAEIMQRLYRLMTKSYYNCMRYYIVTFDEKRTC